MDEEYEFQATGDACGICAALDGTNYSSKPHPNCLCQIVPVEKECTYQLDEHGLTHYGTGKYNFTFGGGLTVFCPDGSEAGGESVEWDASGYDPEGSWSDFANGLIDAAVAELCENCQAEEPPNFV
ncbi:MAG: hypothetical protein M3R69_01245 [Acidobacteriota bacterium]|nr:hypothetical protein [Acidobacteriota bacterium]